MEQKKHKRKKIVIVASLDTRGDEAKFLKGIFKDNGFGVVVVDTGVMGTPFIPADFPREVVAGEGGKSLSVLIKEAEAGADRKAATDVMTAGAKKIVMKLFSAGKIDGIMCFGGTTSAASGISIMTGLPIGFPKLLITTFIAFAPVGEEDITVMQSPVDLIGLNKIIARTLANAAGAIMGMIGQDIPKSGKKKLVGFTVLGVTTPAVQKAILQVESRGYDCISFHATTAKLDKMAKDGIIDAIIDMTTFEAIPKALYTDELITKMTGATVIDRSRLSCTFDRYIPQVVAPGGLDMHIFPGATGIDLVPDPYKGRAYTMHGPNICLVRTSKEELKKVSKTMAMNLNRAKGPVVVVIPLQGFSEASKKGAPLYDPEADHAFIASLKGNLDKKIIVREVNCHINDDGFTREIIEAFDEISRKRLTQRRS